MASLLQLVFESVGADATAAAAVKVGAAVSGLVTAVNASAKPSVDLAQAVEKVTTRLTEVEGKLGDVAKVAPQATAAVDQQAAAAARSAQVNAAVSAAMERLRGSVRAIAAETPAATAAIDQNTAAQVRGNAAAASNLTALQRAVQAGIASDIAFLRQAASTDTVTVATTKASVAQRSLGDRMRDTSAVLTDKLIPRLDPAAGQLLAVGAAALSLRAAYGLLVGALNQGNDLYYLSLRTGENIRSLVIEEQAFRNTGAGANYLGTAINLVDRALSPAASNARANAQVFRQLGVSVDELRSQDFAGRIQTLSDAFARLPSQAERAALAMRLFGEDQGGRMLQLLGDPMALAVAEQQAGRFAERMQQLAPRLAQLHTDMQGAKVELQAMAAAALDQLIPALRTVNSIFESLAGARLGTVLGTAGPTAGLGFAAMWGVDKLQLALNNAAKDFGTGLKGEILGAARSATGALATALPYGLAAAIAGQIVAGILQAYEDAGIADLRLHNQRVVTEVQPLRDEWNRISSQDAAANVLTSAHTRLAGMIVERDALQEKKASRENRGGTPNMALDAGLDLGPDAFTEYDAEHLSVLDEAIKKLINDIVNSYANQAEVAKQIASNQLAKLKESIAPLVARLPDLEKRHEQLLVRAGDPQAEIANLQKQRTAAEQELANLPTSKLTSDEVKAKTLDLENQILQLKKDEQAVEQRITAEKEKQAREQVTRDVFELETKAAQAQAAGNEKLAAELKEQARIKQEIGTLDGIDKAQVEARVTAEHRIWELLNAQRDARNAVGKEQTDLDNKLTGIRSTVTDLDSDYGMTRAEKWAKRREEIQKSISILTTARDSDLAAAQAQRDAGNEKAAQVFDKAAAGHSGEIVGATAQLGRMGPNPNSLTDQMKYQVNSLSDQLGTVQEGIAAGFGNVITTGLGAASAGLQKLIGDTEFWTSKLGTIGGPIMGAITQSITQMFTTWIVQRGLAAAKNMFWSKAEGVTDATAKAPGAVLSSISSFGVAAAVGVAAVIAAMAAFGGFDQGGRTMPGQKNQVAGVVHAGEWVAPQWMVNHPLYGPMIDGLESARAGTPGYEVGGFVKLLARGLPRWAQDPLQRWIADRYNLATGTELYGDPSDAGAFTYSVPNTSLADVTRQSAAAAALASSPPVNAAAQPQVAGSQASRESARNFNLFFDMDRYRQQMVEDMSAQFRTITIEELDKRMG